MGSEDGLAAVASAAAQGTASPSASKAAAEVDPAPAQKPVQEASSAAAEPPAARSEKDIIAAAARDERTRIGAIDAIALPGCESIVSEAKESGASVEQCALSMVRHIKATGALDISCQMAAAAQTVPDIDAAPHDPSGEKKLSADAPIKDRAQREWDGSAEVRAEFGGDFASYLAFREGEEKGTVRTKKK